MGRRDRPPSAIVVVPIRSFRTGLTRLSSRLDDDARSALARRLADTVLDAAGEVPVVVVSSDPDVLAWAVSRDAAVIADPGSLDDAADAGRTYARAHDARRVVIAHADLPFATALDRFADTQPASDRVAHIVPDRRDDGTPVMSLPVDADVRFAYGTGSFTRHCEAARSAGLTVEIVRDAALGFDIDEPADLDAAAALEAR
jgi:2-phospho-L-lactate guanylyltransferase